MGIHHAGHHHKIAGLVHRHPWHNFVEPGNGRNYATVHMNRRRALAFRRNHAFSAHN
jgi:hypothetical protein